MDLFGTPGIQAFISEAAGFADDLASVVETVVEPEVVTSRVVYTITAGHGGALPSQAAPEGQDSGPIGIPASLYSSHPTVSFHPKQTQLSTKTDGPRLPPKTTLRTSTSLSVSEPTTSPPSPTSLPAQLTGSTSTTMSTALPSLFDTNGSDKQHGPPKAAVIAGATVGGLAGLAAILAILILCFRRRRRLMPTRAARRGSIESARSSDASFFSRPQRRSIWDTSVPQPLDRNGPSTVAGKDMTIARKPVPQTMSSLIPAAHWRNNDPDAPQDPASSSEDIRRPPQSTAELAAQPTPPRQQPSKEFAAPRPAPTTMQPAAVARGQPRDRSQPLLAPPLPIIPPLTSQPTGPPPQRPPRPQEPIDPSILPQLDQNPRGPPVPGTGQNRLNELHFDFDLTPGGQYNRQPGYMNNRGQPPPRFNLNPQEAVPGPGPRGPRPSRLPLAQSQNQWPPTYPTVHQPYGGPGGPPPRRPGPSPMDPYSYERPAPAPQGGYHRPGPSNNNFNQPPPKRQRGPAIRVVTPTDSTFPIHTGSDSVSSNVTQTYPPVPSSSHPQPHTSGTNQRYHVNPSQLGPHYPPNQRYPPQQQQQQHHHMGRPLGPSAYTRPNPSGFAGDANNYQGLSPGYGPGPSLSPGYAQPPGRFSAYAPSILSAATSKHVSYDEYGRRRRSDPFDLE